MKKEGGLGGTRSEAAKPAKTVAKKKAAKKR
jgi:hypothetical protein